MTDARHLRAHPGWTTLVALLVAGLATGAFALSTSGGGAPVPASGAAIRVAGPLAAGARVRFTLLLRLPGAARLRATLAAIEDPRSPQFRHFISPRSFGARFGLPQAKLRALYRQLAAQGIRIVESFPQRTELTVTATVATVRRVLGVALIGFRAAGGYFHAPLRAPSIPAGLRWALRAVTGLDTRPRFLAHDVPVGGLTPPLATSAYDLTRLHDAGFSGQGQTIAVISFSAFDPSDPATFASNAGLNGPEPRVVPVDGGTTDLSAAIEANLDIDVIRSIAPQAQILVYELPQSTSAYSDAINRIVADHIQIISSSWGQCERGIDSGERAADSQALQAAVAAGVTMFVSSGDSGAYDCQQADPTDHRLSVDWPASSPNAVAVGGTRLYLNQDGSYAQESAWEDTLSQAGGGGGVTTGDARPSWQVGPGVVNRFSNGRRQVPDVSADADPGTPWGIFANGQSREVGGTSAAAPFWASSMLLIGQYAAAHGIARLGYANPILYALAARPQSAGAFHDVTLGANRYYQATPSWDFATGLGSPDVYNLALDMVAYARAHPGR